MAAPLIRRHHCHLILALMMVDIHLQAWVAMGQVTGTSSSSSLGMHPVFVPEWSVQVGKFPADPVLPGGNPVDRIVSLYAFQGMLYSVRVTKTAYRFSSICTGFPWFSGACFWWTAMRWPHFVQRMIKKSAHLCLQAITSWYSRPVGSIYVTINE